MNQTPIIYIHIYIVGVESTQRNPAAVRRLEKTRNIPTRKTLKMDTTFVDRANTNKQVFEKANEQIKQGREGKKNKKENEL